MDKGQISSFPFHIGATRFPSSSLLRKPNSDLSPCQRFRSKYENTLVANLVSILMNYCYKTQKPQFPNGNCGFCVMTSKFDMSTAGAD